VSLPQRIEVDFEVEEHHSNYRTFDLSSAAAQLLGFACDLYGWTLKNPSGSTAAVIDLYDSPDGTGTPVFPLTIPTSATLEAWFGPNGVRLNNALYANVTAGEVKGSVFYRHVRR
jgi:hypothetical protein